MNRAFFTLGILFLSFNSISQTNLAKHNYWKSTLDDSSGALKMIKVRPINADSFNVKSMIDFLNGKNSKPTDNNYIIFQKIFKDTIFIKINNTEYLTQKIGTAGAMLYLAEVTYNLTELDNINYVKMDFEEGDHASPGTFSRNDFANQ